MNNYFRRYEKKITTYVEMRRKIYSEAGTIEQGLAC